ncbi:endonuclease/exonuclease/phosphatase family protein [Cryptosporangium minutisporangium]
MRTSGTPSGTTVRVATWNLWWRFGDWEARHRAIGAVLADLRADIVGLQEVWAEPGRNQAEALAADLGLHWTFVASPAPGRWHRRLGDDRVAVGNAVLSRWPIVESAHQVLPAGDAPADGRTVLHARIDAPGGPVPFFTTQLNSAPAQSAVRCAQVAAIARFVAARTEQSHPPVVTGDLNAEPDSDEVRLLGGHKTAPTVPGLVLIDAWRYADPAATGWTWDRGNPHVAASLEPSARIDYVLVGAPSADGRGSVASAAVFGDRLEGGVWPSDHAGVLAELRA